jgi:transketolase
MSNNKLMRDAFIDEIYRSALKDKDVVFISADFGAVALDDFRKNLPEQFIHAGISEQNMVDVGVGLALTGKKVFLYAMAPFITTRCYEQTKAVVSSMQLPITLIAVGVGLGYDHATLTHFTTEDIAIMRALNGIRILTPVDSDSALYIAKECVNNPKFTYVRLERNPQPPLYGDKLPDYLDNGYVSVHPGRDFVLVSSGYMTHKALKVREILLEDGIDLGVIDVFRIKPISHSLLSKLLSNYKAVITIEEQMLDGGFGSAIIETLADSEVCIPVKRIGINDKFKVVNGDREHLNKLYSIDVDSMVSTVKLFIKGKL